MKHLFAILPCIAVFSLTFNQASAAQFDPKVLIDARQHGEDCSTAMHEDYWITASESCEYAAEDQQRLLKLVQSADDRDVLLRSEAMNLAFAAIAFRQRQSEVQAQRLLARANDIYNALQHDPKHSSESRAQAESAQKELNYLFSRAVPTPPA